MYTQNKQRGHTRRSVTNQHRSIIHYVIVTVITWATMPNETKTSVEEHNSPYVMYNIEEEKPTVSNLTLNEQTETSSPNVETEAQEPSTDATEATESDSGEYTSTEPYLVEADNQETISTGYDSTEPYLTEPEEQTDDQTSNMPDECSEQTSDESEDFYTSDQELEDIMNGLYVECGHDPDWNLFQDGTESRIWIEQYEPFTESLVNKLGNLIYYEVGAYISTQPYEKAIRTYMLAGSVVLHRLEVGYTEGTECLYDVVNVSGQYETSWAFDLDTPMALKDYVDECYIVAERLLRYGPIGPRNLVYQSGGEQGEDYWNTGEDIMYATTYFGTSPDFEGYDS